MPPVGDASAMLTDLKIGRAAASQITRSRIAAPLPLPPRGSLPRITRKGVRVFRRSAIQSRCASTNRRRTACIASRNASLARKASRLSSFSSSSRSSASCWRSRFPRTSASRTPRTRRPLRPTFAPPSRRPSSSTPTTHLHEPRCRRPPYAALKTAYDNGLDVGLIKTYDSGATYCIQQTVGGKTSSCHARPERGLVRQGRRCGLRVSAASTHQRSTSRGARPSGRAPRCRSGPSRVAAAPLRSLVRVT